MLYWILQLCSSTLLSRAQAQVSPMFLLHRINSWCRNWLQLWSKFKTVFFKHKSHCTATQKWNIHFAFANTGIWCVAVHLHHKLLSSNMSGDGVVKIETTIGVWKQFYRSKKPFNILLWSDCRRSPEHMVVCRRRKKHIKASLYLLHESSKTDVKMLSFKLYLSDVGINSDGSVLPGQQWRSDTYAFSISSHVMCLCSPCGAQKTREQLKPPPQGLGTWTTTLTPESRMLMLCHFFVQRWARESE